MRLLVIAVVVWLASLANAAPDVLFIVVDDLNDWNSLLDPTSPVQLPNLERLAQRGTLFSRAYCMSAACNPSRAATLTGLRPTTSGVYGNKSDWRRAMPKRRTIMQRFRDAGYDVRGAGKIFHHHLNGAFHDEASFDDFQHMRCQLYPDKKLNGAAKYGSRNTDWGEWPPCIEDSIDFGTASYCIGQLERTDRERPLFLACGIFKPHSPFFAPSPFHEPHRNLQPPPRDPDDWHDLPAGARSLMKGKKWFWSGMQRMEQQQPGSWNSFVQAYASCATFADAQIGRVLDALDRSGRKETIVVLWSDHGFHLGEKDHIEKFALWEKSNHIPFILVAPGVSRPGTRCDQPIDLSVLYPTLVELCDLPGDDVCDGRSAVPLLKNPHAEWNEPALMTWQRGNHAVRDERWRYIRYADGSEELYDHDADPREWTNVAGQSEHESVIKDLRRWLPASEAIPVKDLRLSGR